MAYAPRTRSLFLLAALLAACCSTAGAQDNDRRILHALEESTHIEMEEVELQDVVDYLGDLHNIPIVIDKTTLAKAGAKYRTFTVTKKLPMQTPLRVALRAILSPHGLSYLVKDGKLTVTTREAAKEWQKAFIESK